MKDHAELKAKAQQELESFRRQSGRGWALLSSRRLLVLPDRLMTRLGGAAAIWRWTCVSPALLRAPDEVRQAVIAHEWGHARAGHCLATMGSLFGAAAYIASSFTQPPTPLWTALNILLLAGTCGAVLWAIHPNRELEADAVAVDLIGADQMAKGLRWIADQWLDGDMNENMRKRLARLDAIAESGR